MQLEDTESEVLYFDDLLKYLKSLGMDRDTALIYGTLLTEGSMRVSRLASITKIGRSKVYRILSHLQEENAVYIVNTNPMEYSSASPEEYFDSVLKKREKEITELKKKTGHIVKRYRSYKESDISEPGFTPDLKFRFLRSEKSIVSAANKEINRAVKSIGIMLDRDKFYMLRNSETVRMLAGKVKEGVEVRVLTELTEDIVELLDAVPKVLFNIRFRKASFFPTFVIVDKKSIVTVLDDGIPYRKGMKRVLPVALHVNSLNFIQKMCNLFNYAWKDAKPYVKKH